jgi:hypothetical protein
VLARRGAARRSAAGFTARESRSRRLPRCRVRAPRIAMAVTAADYERIVSLVKVLATGKRAAPRRASFPSPRMCRVQAHVASRPPDAQFAS